MRQISPCETLNEGTKIQTTNGYRGLVKSSDKDSAGVVLHEIDITHKYNSTKRAGIITGWEIFHESRYINYSFLQVI